jgi:hypothetical protein
LGESGFADAAELDELDPKAGEEEAAIAATEETSLMSDFFLSALGNEPMLPIEPNEPVEVAGTWASLSITNNLPDERDDFLRSKRFVNFSAVLDFFMALSSVGDARLLKSEDPLAVEINC